MPRPPEPTDGDEEYARNLAAKFEAEKAEADVEMARRHETDEEFARRLASEDAEIAGAGKRPVGFLGMGEVVFRRPVRVGHLLRLRSRVVANGHNWIAIEVHARILDPAAGTSDVSNNFQFFFRLSDVLPLLIFW